MTAENLIEIIIKRLPNGDYLATSTDLPSLVAQGRSVAENIDIARDVARKLIESYREHVDPLPKGLKKRKGSTLKISIPVAIE